MGGSFDNCHCFEEAETVQRSSGISGEGAGGAHEGCWAQAGVEVRPWVSVV